MIRFNKVPITHSQGILKKIISNCAFLRIDAVFRRKSTISWRFIDKNLVTWINLLLSDYTAKVNFLIFRTKFKTSIGIEILTPLLSWSDCAETVSIKTILNVSAFDTGKDFEEISCHFIVRNVMKRNSHVPIQKKLCLHLLAPLVYDWFLTGFDTNLFNFSNCYCILFLDAKNFRNCLIQCFSNCCCQALLN